MWSAFPVTAEEKTVPPKSNVGKPENKAVKSSVKLYKGKVKNIWSSLNRDKVEICKENFGKLTFWDT